MKRTLLATLLAVTAASASATEASKADKAVGRVLDSLEYSYDIDDDGDYKMVFDLDDDRTQLVFVRSSVETFGKHRIREIWSPGYEAPGGQFPVAVANRLLEDSQDAKLGAWVKQDKLAMFVVKVDADASADQLSDAIDAATRTADAMELELTQQDEF